MKGTNQQMSEACVKRWQIYKKELMDEEQMGGE